MPPKPPIPPIPPIAAKGLAPNPAAPAPAPAPAGGLPHGLGRAALLGPAEEEDEEEAAEVVVPQGLPVAEEEAAALGASRGGGKGGGGVRLRVGGAEWTFAPINPLLSNGRAGPAAWAHPIGRMKGPRDMK